MKKVISNNQELVKLYQLCNEVIFSKELPTIKVEWSNRMTRIAGNITYKMNRATKTYKDFRIALSVPYHKKYTDEIMETLVHEMIHLKYPGTGHGIEFKTEMNRINKEHDMNVTVFSSGRATPKVYKHKYECTGCSQLFNRVNRIPQGAVCGACESKLKKI